MASTSLRWCPLQGCLSHTALMLALQKNIVAKMGSPEHVFTGKPHLKNSSICCTLLLSALRCHMHTHCIHIQMSFELLDSNCSGSQNTESIHSCSLLVLPPLGASEFCLYSNGLWHILDLFCFCLGFHPNYLSL